MIVGDVVGHGARAATLAAVARYTVRTLAVLESSPRRVLSGLNDTVLGRGEPERFLSAIYLSTKKTARGIDVLLARGGHPPALLRRADGTVEQVEASGALLGCMADPGLKDVRIRLTRGDLLLLYSDGVTEARQEATEYGELRLRTLLANADPVAHVVVDAVFSAVLAHTDGELADDITVVAFVAT
jgi:serine phosphatase RsbU (regulator of sigma subunit)